MAYRWSADLKDRDVTDEHLFMNRRNFLAGLSEWNDQFYP